MKLKIISDGTPTNTKVVDVDTGEELRGVTSIEWSVKPREDSGGGHDYKVRLVMEYMPLEIEVDGIKKYELRNDDHEDTDTAEDLREVLGRMGFKLDEITDEERELFHKMFPAMATHRRET